MQAKFGNQPGPKVEESITKTAKEAVDGVKDTWRLARDASDDALAGVQKQFDNHSERSTSLTVDQQLRKTAQDTWDDAKSAAAQAKSAFSKSSANDNTHKNQKSEEDAVRELMV